MPGTEHKYGGKNAMIQLMAAFKTGFAEDFVFGEDIPGLTSAHHHKQFVMFDHIQYWLAYMIYQTWVCVIDHDEHETFNHYEKVWHNCFIGSASAPYLRNTVVPLTEWLVTAR